MTNIFSVCDFRSHTCHWPRTIYLHYSFWDPLKDTVALHVQRTYNLAKDQDSITYWLESYALFHWFISFAICFLTNNDSYTNTWRRKNEKYRFSPSLIFLYIVRKTAKKRLLTLSRPSVYPTGRILFKLSIKAFPANLSKKFNFH